MRIAVVVPFCSEPAEWLQVCFNSVLAQSTPAQIIAVGDGAKLSEKKIEAVPLYKLIELPEAHGDGGAAARCIGAIEAITSGFDAVAFLDADNWLSPVHLSEMVRLHRATGAPLCTGTLSIVRVDGSAWEGLRGESDGDKHADTNTLFLTREAFPLLLNWALVPRELGNICDRPWWQLAKSSGYKRAHLELATVFYRNRYAQQYRLRGEPVPDGCKELPKLRPGTYSVKVPAMEMEGEISSGGFWTWGQR
jgi:glycosyltransferase involved in cell wall biosynthesis